MASSATNVRHHFVSHFIHAVHGVLFANDQAKLIVLYLLDLNFIAINMAEYLPHVDSVLDQRRLRLRLSQDVDRHRDARMPLVEDETQDAVVSRRKSHSNPSLPFRVARSRSLRETGRRLPLFPGAEEREPLSAQRKRGTSILLIQLIVDGRTWKPARSQ